MASFCQDCQTNGKDVRVEWKISKRTGGKYMWEIDNNQLHKCPYYDPTKKKQKKESWPGQEQAKEAVKEYNQKFPKEDANYKLELGISQQIELATQSILLTRDIIRLAKGEEVELLLAQKDEEIAGLKEALRQADMTKKASEIK